MLWGFKRLLRLCCEWNDNTELAPVGNMHQDEYPDFSLSLTILCNRFSGICGLVYFLFGILLIDRFKSDSFVTIDDPVVTTAIPSPDAIEALDDPGNRPPVAMQGP